MNVRLLSALALSVLFAFKGQYTTAVIVSALTLLIHYFFRTTEDAPAAGRQRKARRDEVRALLAAVPNISESRAKNALSMCNNNVEKAIEMLEKSQGSLRNQFLERKHAMFDEARRKYLAKHSNEARA
ncbi:hypothetical protein PTSG_00573 [Salpingoeca rosetta]|uniref:CUE domain-containing protein n=1 Tax=Salpingoeca rosetta (strain ATCC 50818 / BSB-021) TaxID=946362 RepID=F2TWV3_SALR5|nr:uncharacterized protein PTSG_00573 [Salpingoeca rosetta]EGD72549.1 hypothetical protein PTSG_00573 [Salpingoeca rosetta]|eukprot:XP_004999118.1 hypothetical protein PTSG_00573 [Salpingoeca rosetta]